MHWMALHPEEAAQMGRKAREYAKDRHGLERHYRKLVKVYEEIKGVQGVH
jgi:hypothetical protein